MFHEEHFIEDDVLYETSKLPAIDRLKLLKVIDFDNKILPKKSTKNHLALLDFVTKTKRGAVCAFRGFGKSTSVLAHYLPTEALTSPTDRVIMIFSNSLVKSQDWIVTIAGILERFIQAGFDCSKGDYWSKNTIHFVNEFGKKIIISAFSPLKDPRGVNKELQRPTDIICDDLESDSPNALMNAKTRGGREKMENYFFGSLMPSLKPSSRFIIVGTILHNESLLSKLLKDDSFERFILPAIVNGKSSWARQFPLTEEDRNVLCETYPSDFPTESLETIEKRFRNMGQIDIFHREYLCEAASAESKIFKKEMFRYHGGIIYENFIDEIEVKDGINSRKIQIKTPQWININGENISLNKMRRFLCIDNASDGGDSHAMIVAANYEGNIYILDIAGGIRYTPFDKACDLLRLTLEWRCDYGSEKGGMQNDYLYINKALITEYREHYIKRAFYPTGYELKTHGRAKNVRISQLQIPMLEGKIFFNPNCPMNSYLENQLMDFVMDAENKDDYPDALAYFLQVFGFVNFAQAKPKGSIIDVNFMNV